MFLVLFYVYFLWVTPPYTDRLEVQMSIIILALAVTCFSIDDNLFKIIQWSRWLTLS